MSARLWWALDAVAHALYVPTMLGRRHARARWHHRLHLIPAWVMRFVCDRYDRSLDWEPAGPDLRPACFDRIFDDCEPAVTVAPDGFGCVHMQMWSNSLVGKPTFGCGCVPQALWRTAMS